MTLKIREDGARATDCAVGSNTCAEGDGWATKQFNGQSIADIRSGAIKHHLDIDYWYSWNASSLTVSNVRMLGGRDF